MGGNNSNGRGNKGTDKNNEMFLVDHDGTDKQRRIKGNREPNSQLSKCNSDRKH